MKNFILTISIIFSLIGCKSTKSNQYSISGNWSVALDSTDIGISQNWSNRDFDQKIALPGTTDDAGLGIPNALTPKLEKPQLLHLTRKYSYLGAAWYTREIQIPSDWRNKNYLLKLERVIWKTKVWIDGKELPEENTSLIAPHYFDLTDYIKAEKTHRITVMVDNRKIHDISVRDLAHAYTNDTQIIWNGIIGEMSIDAVDPVRIDNVQVTPDISTKEILVTTGFINQTNNSVKGRITITAEEKGTKKQLPAISREIEIKSGSSKDVTAYPIGESMKLWDEFSPQLYQLEVRLESGSLRSAEKVDFGMRKFSHEGSVLTINDRPLFLRGTLECNIFPLTGHPPMEKEGWNKVFKTAKEWGLNHLRFHSWCPPKAAFESADELGFYLQVELPVWIPTIGEKEETTKFLYDEANRIIKEYGNHPSFCMWSMGNELEGDMSVLAKMVDHLKGLDSRHLYSNTSFSFQKGHGAWPEPNDDFFITQWTQKGWVRGQGVFNSESPSFNKNYGAAIEGMTVPLITHEIGQYAVYPNLEELPKYTGVLDPLNFKAIKEDLERKKLIDYAPDYTKASGKLAALLYKEEIERALKTTGISGFQLLDLHDFPGQGTALVGLLDAFWDSKGVIDSEQFRQFCAPVVPLINFEKAVFMNDETFTGKIDVSNYSTFEMQDRLVEWSVKNDDVEIAKGSFTSHLKIGYNSNIGQINVNLAKVTVPSKLKIEISLPNTEYKNQWNIWVYPKQQTVDYGHVSHTGNLQEAYKLLEEGKTVLFNPDWRKIKGIEGKFVPVFWSPVHFPKQAGTMGMLVDPIHKAFELFPTDMHTDWQWWDLNINSITMIVDSIQGGNPIVQMVDNFTNNRRLALIYEGKIGKGKIIIASCDLSTDLDGRPVARQMLISILKYMNSENFNPSVIKNPEILKQILSDSEGVKKQSAISIY